MDLPGHRPWAGWPGRDSDATQTARTILTIVSVKDCSCKWQIFSSPRVTTRRAIGRLTIRPGKIVVHWAKIKCCNSSYSAGAGTHLNNTGWTNQGAEIRNGPIREQLCMKMILKLECHLIFSKISLNHYVYNSSSNNTSAFISSLVLRNIDR